MKNVIKINIIMKGFLVLIFLIVLLGLVLIPKAFVNFQPVKNTKIFSTKISYDNREPGSWMVKKSAKWVSKDSAEIIFDLDTLKKESNNKDYLIVLDISDSMKGNKINKVKSDTIELLTSLFTANKSTRVGLITFSSFSTIISDFSSDKNELIDKINNLSPLGTTNYYQAFVNIDTVLKEYYNDGAEECVVLFLTDGYPNNDTPNEVGQYKYLKQQYPFITINCVQYEMGDSVLDYMKEISDNQYVASINTLNNVLFNASANAVSYTDFSITDYIDTDYFEILNQDDIDVSVGNIDFDFNEQKIRWNLDGFQSGLKAKMKIKVKLKEKFTKVEGNYTTNKKVEISNVFEGTADNIINHESPVLSNRYKVVYDVNCPSDCSVENVPENESHFVFDIVGIDKKKVVCDGYVFKGWEVVDSNVEMLNSDYFTMPDEDVVLRAKWGKLNINKSADGKVFERLTLYEQVEADVKDSRKYAKKYTGDTSSFNGKENVYYYYGNASNNNVVFANYCWKIVRTTDTGGVKLLYNGVPDSNGSCGNSGSSSALTREQIGQTTNKVKYNVDNKSPGTVGYMYDVKYDRHTKWAADDNDKIIRGLSMTDDVEYHYFDNVKYRDDYSAYYVDPKSLYKWGDSKQDLVGKYTCASGTEDGAYNLCTKVYYIIHVEENMMYFLILENGMLLEDMKLSLSSEVVRNEDGTFTQVNPVVINKADWFTDYKSYVNFYTCGNAQDTCSDMRYITETEYWYYFYAKNYKFGKSFTYENGKYNLTDVDYIWSEPNSYDEIDENRYTCFDSTGQCESVSYVYYISSKEDGMNYMLLENGVSAQVALNRMLYSDEVNKNDSNVKAVVDYWYQDNLLEYTSYLEDTVWCNNRASSENPWSDDGTSTGILYFKSAYKDNSLICNNRNDRFTVSSDSGNGKLKYPVGLLTAYETVLAYDNDLSPLNSGNKFWSMSPVGFSNVSQVLGIQNNGYYYTEFVTNDLEVRPSVSLKTGIRYLQGDGSVKHPYVVELD